MIQREPPNPWCLRALVVQPRLDCGLRKLASSCPPLRPCASARERAFPRLTHKSINA